MITIDGSQGEGGGQVLRTSLALSLVTGKAFTVENIRSGRKKPGLMRQHLTSVNAAAEVGQADVNGNSIGSEKLEFNPTTVKAGRYNFSIGTAGSCTLVLQTVLPALLLADESSELTLEGGTHNHFAPPFDFLTQAFLPIISRMGPKVTADLHCPGFYPAGGGSFTVTIEPVASLQKVDILQRGEVKRRQARALVARVPEAVAKKELNVVREKLGWQSEHLQVEEVKNSRGPGNVLFLEIESENVTEVITGFGEKGVSAQRVAEGAVREARQYLDSGAPVGKYLADQLLIPMALAGGGRFRTLPPTLHTRTNTRVIKEFLDVHIEAKELEKYIWEISVNPL